MIGLIIVFSIIALCIVLMKRDSESNYKELLMTDKGNKVFKEKIKRGDYIYAILERDDKNKGNSNLIIYNKKSDVYKKYNLDCVVNGLDAYKNNIYYIHTEHNGKNTSYITKNNINHNKISTKVDDIVLCHVSVYKNNLYVFGFDYDKEGIFSKMYVYDADDLSMKREIDFGNYIIDVTDTYMVNDKLYISGRSSRKKEYGQYVEVDNKHICEINIKNYSMRKIYIGDISYQILVLESKIYVSNYDEVLDEGNIIYEVDYQSRMRKKHVMKEKVKDIYTYYNKLLKS